MEEEVCDHLRKMPAHKITDGFKQKLLSSIASNEDVLFTCCQQMQMKRMPRPY